MHMNALPIELIVKLSYYLCFASLEGSLTKQSQIAPGVFSMATYTVDKRRLGKCACLSAATALESGPLARSLYCVYKECL